MSAFICNSYHVSVLASYAIHHRCSEFYNPDRSTRIELRGESEIFDLLLDENYKSVNCRYNENNQRDEQFIPTAYWLFNQVTPVDRIDMQIIKACHCLHYQSCEHSAYRQSDAYHVLQAIEGLAVRRLLPDNLEWELTPIALPKN